MTFQVWIANFYLVYLAFINGSKIDKGKVKSFLQVWSELNRICLSSIDEAAKRQNVSFPLRRLCTASHRRLRRRRTWIKQNLLHHSSICSSWNRLPGKKKAGNFPESCLCPCPTTRTASAWFAATMGGRKNLDRVKKLFRGVLGVSGPPTVVGKSIFSCCCWNNENCYDINFVV